MVISPRASHVHLVSINLTCMLTMWMLFSRWSLFDKQRRLSVESEWTNVENLKATKLCRWVHNLGLDFKEWVVEFF